MKKLFILLLLLVLTLCSCGKKEELLHYQTYPFEGEFEVLQNDFKFTLRVSGDRWNGENERFFAAEFLMPQDLKGIKISKEDGKIKFSLGGIEFEENRESSASLCDFARYFELTASPESFEKENGETVAHLVSSDGEKIKIIFSKEGLPAMIEGEKMQIKVISYKTKE